MKILRSLVVCALISTLFSVISTQSSYAGIESAPRCALDFKSDIAIQPTVANPAFTFEMKYSVVWDPDFKYNYDVNPAPNGGVYINNHSMLLGSDDDTSGLKMW